MSAPILHILTHEFYPHRGGIATVTEEMALAAAKSGAVVEVWAPALPPKTLEKPWPFPIHRLPLHGTHDFWCLLQMGRVLIRERRRLRQATVWLSEPGPMLTLMGLQFFRAFCPSRLILTFHGSEILRFQRNPLTRWLTRRLIRHATRISTLTHHTRELLCRHFPGAAAKTCLTPGALRAGFTAPPAAPPAVTDRLVILTVGRLHPRKGQLQTLQALLALPAERRTRIAYWLVGSSSHRHRYEAQLRTLAATADFPVQFLGNLTDDQLDAAYGQAAIFALTSVAHGPSVEGFGLVYLEAAAHGLPVVAHAIGGVSEAVADGTTGLLVSPGDPAALTSAFSRLIDDAPLRQRLGAAGRVRAHLHNWRDSARRLFDLPASSASPS
jgi:glycosyltransferase involved in cell wall biosynthesis